MWLPDFLEDVMPEKPQPDRVPDEETPPHPAEPLQIDTPVIDLQISSERVKIEPRMDDADARDPVKEDAWAIDAMQAFEKSLREQLPG